MQVLYNYGRQTELIYGGIEYPSEKHHGQCIKIKNRVTPGEGGNPPGACEKKKKNRVKHRLYPGERIEGEQEGTEMNTKETETWRS